jgi:ribosomal protein S18 acetylase RimI-like enzyme
MAIEPAEIDVRRATLQDTGTVTEIISLAFANDPLWAFAMAAPDGRIDHMPLLWRLYVEGALANGWTWLADESAAASLWIPPNGFELTPDQEVQLDVILDDRLGRKAPVYRELMARFEAHHPREEAHYYLTLLGTHPAHRGRGIGMRLLAHDLTLIDAQHAAAYLESSNPANNERYGRLGFEATGRFEYPGGGPVVTTMWRAAR